VLCLRVTMSASNERSTRHLKMSDQDLERFVKRVAEMRAAGHQTWYIADQLGVPKTTIREREKRYQAKQRGVAQSGSASGSGPEGRRFESSHPDPQNGVLGR
jgi:hypothetical protein